MSRRCSSWLLAVIVAWVLLACGWSASASLDYTRAYDERFSIRNVQKALETGSLHPQNGFYSRLSYLPQTGIIVGYRLLHDLTGAESAVIFGKGGDMKPMPLFIARFFSVLCGAAGAIMTFLIGRRLFSSEVALLGTVLLVSCPWLLRHFVIFKADALANLLVLVAFYWSLRAAENGTVRRFVLAGLGVGLAASAKYTGALIAIPLIVAAVLARDRLSSSLRKLTLAGVSSIAVFLLLHPYLSFYWNFFRTSVRTYSAVEQKSFASMLASEVGVLLHWAMHGPIVGAVALAGVAALCIRLYRLRGDRSRFTELAMFLSFPLGYSVVYSLVTTLAKGNNYLILLPFTSLAAAWLLHASWKLVSARLPTMARRLVFWPALIGVLAMVTWPAHAFIYEEAVTTTTLDRVGGLIRTASLATQKTAIFEPDIGSLIVTIKGPDSETHLLTREVPALTDEPDGVLDAVDFEVFGEERLRGEKKDFYLRRLRRIQPGQVVTLHPEWFRSRGSSQVVLRHPWFPVTRAQPIVWKTTRTAAGRFGGKLPFGPQPEMLISLDIHLPQGWDHIESLTVGDRSFEPVSAGFDEQGRQFRTERFSVSKGNLKVRLKFDQAWGHEESPQVAVWSWRAFRPALAGGVDPQFDVEASVQ